MWEMSRWIDDKLLSISSQQLQQRGFIIFDKFVLWVSVLGEVPQGW